MDKETRIEIIMGKYRRRSEELFEVSLDPCCSYLSGIVHRSEVRGLLGDMGLIQLPKWVDSGQIKEHMRKMYPIHIKNFSFIFYEDKDEKTAELTRICLGICGFNFDKEAKNLRQYLEKKSDISIKELVDRLIEGRGIYAARAIIDSVSGVNLFTGPGAMIEYIWMRAMSDVCTRGLKEKNKGGIAIPDYDGWLSLK